MSNLTVALKKNGAIRLCVDLREVNKAVIPDQYPLPTVNESFHTFRGATVFTKIDLRWGYNQIPLAEAVGSLRPLLRIKACTNING